MNKKGFVLTETIIVTVFIVTIFTFVFSSVFPLIGTYEDLAEREENIDILYKLYNIRKMINNDSSKNDLLKEDYKELTCSDFDNTEVCEKLMEYLELDSYELVYANGINDNYEILKNINDEIGTYLATYEEENNRTLILLDKINHTIGDINVYDNNTNASYTIKNNILKAHCSSTITDSDGTIYLSGNNDCIKFNYVWYSGKLWRITAIYPDGVLKLVTENAITSIPYGTDYNFYTNNNNKSYVYQWLNEDFLSTLANYRNILTNEKKWNATAPSSNTTTTKLPNTNLVTAYVGLLDSYEFYKSYEKIGNSTLSYLEYNNGLSKPAWFVLHPYDPSLSNIQNGKGVRPSVYLKSDVNFSGGEGTYENPFTILGDIAKGAVGDRINTRVSGEFIKFKSNDNAPTYRIVSIEPNGGNIITKVIANYYAVNNSTRKPLAKGNTFGSEVSSSNYWDYYLNNSLYNSLVSQNGELFLSGTYYLGKGETQSPGNESYCYKEAICSYCDPTIPVRNCSTLEAKTFNVGLPRLGEMFSGGLSTQSLAKLSTTYKQTWLITTFNQNRNFRIINQTGETINNNEGYLARTNSYWVQPMVYLKTTVSIKSGSGTFIDPYVVG